MTPQEIARERASVMIAWADGKTIQCKAKAWVCGSHAANHHAQWSPPCNNPPGWNWFEYDYRIKPEPRVIYVSNGLAKSDAYSKEHAERSGIHNFTKFQEVP